MKTFVAFTSNNIEIAGIVFKPDDWVGRQLPAVVVTHPAGGVKEQTASLYAERLADQGFVTLVFDAAYQGESGGLPRGLEDPFQRVEDVKSAVSYLTTRRDVLVDSIGAVGICASGSYVPYAAQTDRRIKAVAMVFGIDLPATIFESDEARDFLLDQAAVLRTAEANGDGLFWSKHTPSTKGEAETFPEGSMFREAWDYYRTDRGGHLRSTQWGPMRLDVAAQFDSWGHNAWISPRPFLAIAGSEADTLPFSEQAIAVAQEPKELFVIDGATHVDLYDKNEYVPQAVAKLIDYFGKHLPA